MGRKKRVREPDPVDVDSSGPISKRINQLRIERTAAENDSSSNSFHSHKQTSPEHPMNYTSPNDMEQLLISQDTINSQRHENVNNSNFMNDLHSDVPTASSSSMPPNPNLTFNSMSDKSYRPELTQDDNPFYYSINEQLYYLHMERVNRSKNSL